MIGRAKQRRRGARIFACALVAVVGGLLASPGHAIAGTASIAGIYVQYTANAGETNQVTVSRPGGTDYVIVDATAPVTAGAGCFLVTSNEAHCTPGFGTDTLKTDLGDGNDTIIFSDLFTAEINGGAGDDTIAPGANACIERLRGDAGADTITAGTGFCGGANSRDDELDGGAGNDVLTAGFTSDRLAGGDGDDVLNGGDGNDRLDGGAGADVLNSGPGGDTVTYADRSVGVTVTLDGVANDGAAGEGDNVAADAESLIGGSGNDSLSGSADSNALEGRDGSDVLMGGGGDDGLDGGAGNDVLDGGPGADSLTSGSGNDAADGGEGNDFFGLGLADAGNDTMNGGGGDDLFWTSQFDGTDVIYGGDGVDQITFQYFNSPAIVSLDGLANDGAPAEGDNVEPDIENLIGTSANDTFVGSASANFFDGQGGADSLNGAGGNDVLVAGCTFCGAAPSGDVLHGGDGDDLLRGTGVGGQLYGDAGTDTAKYAENDISVTLTLDGLANDGYQLDASRMTDNIESDVENLSGGTLNDTLAGNGNANVLDGGLGADTLTGGAGSDTVTYASHAFGVWAEIGGTAAAGKPEDTIAHDVERLVGGPGDDVLVGDAAANVLDGAAGDDVLDGDAGADTLIGGPGDGDVADYSLRSNAVNVTLDGAANDGGAGESDDVQDSIEGIYGGAGNDTLTGNAGDNFFDGGPGADALHGGAGIDAADYSIRFDSVTVSLDGAANDGESSEGDNVGTDVEDIWGGFGDDTLVGSAQSNELDGGDGDDTLDGGLGADTLIGGGGEDDAADYSARSAPVTVRLDGTASSGESGENDTVEVDVEDAVGGAGADTFVGNDEFNLFDGGPGADTFNGGDGFDIVDYSARSQPVTVILDGVANDGAAGEGDNLGGDMEDAVGGSGDDHFTGNGESNFFFGGGGADVLEGGGGDDFLFGGAGADTITGGGGFDEFSGGDGDDTIQSRDNLPEVAFCDAGADSLVADLLDDGDECEAIHRGPPLIVTGAPTAIALTSASLHATVNPAGQATTAYVEIGTTTAYGQRGADFSLPAEIGLYQLTSTWTGLQGGTTYHYRFVATNADGTTNGADQIFTTVAKNATALVVAPASGTYGGKVTLSTTLTQAGAALVGRIVSFSLNGTVMAAATTNASGVATVSDVSLGPVGAGSYATGVGATFAGDATRAPSTGAASLTVAKADQTISLDALPNKSYGAPDFDISATSSSGLPVSFRGTGSCTTRGATVHLTAAGSCTITASQPGDANHNAATDVSQTFRIDPAKNLNPASTCRVPSLAGKTLAAAKLALKQRHCRVGKVSYAYSRKIKKGRVISQSRHAGRVLPASAKVNLVVSRGRKP